MDLRQNPKKTQFEDYFTDDELDTYDSSSSEEEEDLPDEEHEEETIKHQCPKKQPENSTKQDKTLFEVLKQLGFSITPDYDYSKKYDKTDVH
eukprot:gene7601-11924_t